LNCILQLQLHTWIKYSLLFNSSLISLQDSPRLHHPAIRCGKATNEVHLWRVWLHWRCGLSHDPGWVRFKSVHGQTARIGQSVCAVSDRQVSYPIVCLNSNCLAEQKIYIYNIYIYYIFILCTHALPQISTLMTLKIDEQFAHFEWWLLFPQFGRVVMWRQGPFRHQLLHSLS
jgi:hypothetical protein